MNSGFVERRAEASGGDAGEGDDWSTRRILTWAGANALRPLKRVALPVPFFNVRTHFAIEWYTRFELVVVLVRDG